ncbi:hypothetical protein FRC07_008362 [Ceratobasidium sp. 392]|nr:hypothetical protein FRC07_008362 [Ceratobasidium sp. 392]
MPQGKSPPKKKSKPFLPGNPKTTTQTAKHIYGKQGGSNPFKQIAHVMDGGTDSRAELMPSKPEKFKDEERPIIKSKLQSSNKVVKCKFVATASNDEEFDSPPKKITKKHKECPATDLESEAAPKLLSRSVKLTSLRQNDCNIVRCEALIERSRSNCMDEDFNGEAEDEDKEGNIGWGCQVKEHGRKLKSKSGARKGKERKDEGWVCGRQDKNNIEGRVSNYSFFAKRQRRRWTRSTANNWIAEYLKECKNKDNMEAYGKDYLPTVLNQEFVDAMAWGVFETMYWIWTQKEKGTRDIDKAKKDYTRRQNSRCSTNADRKEKGMENTPLCNKLKHKWLAANKIQLPQHSDAKDNGCWVMKEPLWRSKLAIDTSDLLQIKGTKTYDRKLVYI